MKKSVLLCLFAFLIGALLAPSVKVNASSENRYDMENNSFAFLVNLNNLDEYSTLDVNNLTYYHILHFETSDVDFDLYVRRPREDLLSNTTAFLQVDDEYYEFDTWLGNLYINYVFEFTDTGEFMLHLITLDYAFNEDTYSLDVYSTLVIDETTFSGRHNNVYIDIPVVLIPDSYDKVDIIKDTLTSYQFNNLQIYDNAYYYYRYSYDYNTGFPSFLLTILGAFGSIFALELFPGISIGLLLLIPFVLTLLGFLIKFWTKD